MNGKQNEFHTIVDIVLECCKMEHEDRSELKEKVLGNCREEPVVMMRCMLARTMAFAGFTNTTISAVLHKSQQSVRHMLEIARDLRTHNKVYRKAEDEAVTMYQRQEQ